MVQDATTIRRQGWAEAGYSQLVSVICQDHSSLIVAEGPDSGSKVRPHSQLNKHLYMEHAAKYYCVCVCVYLQDPTKDFLYPVCLCVHALLDQLVLLCELMCAISRHLFPPFFSFLFFCSKRIEMNCVSLMIFAPSGKYSQELVAPSQ